MSYSFTGAPVFVTVGTSGTYDITGYGASGGTGTRFSGGLGAEEGGSFRLTAGEQLEIIVGQQGTNGPGNYEEDGGGGGGSFVLASTDGGASYHLLLAAGGGGGGGYYTAGGSGTTGATGNGSGGGANTQGRGAGGGSGVNGAGASSAANYFGGQGGSNRTGNYAGGAGGAGQDRAGNIGAGATGGFGGGGGGSAYERGGGGGGGYTGGSASQTVPPNRSISAGGGYGGTSYDSGTAIATRTVAGENAGNGTVIIALQVAPAITGTTAGQTTSNDAPVDPFTRAKVTDGNNGTDTLTIQLSGGGAGGTLAESGGQPALTANGNGLYTLTAGSAATVTAELQALVFTPTAGAPNTSTTTAFTLTDTSDAAPTMPATGGTTTVTDTDPAVAPTVTGGTAGRTTISDAPVNGVFSGVTVSDSNAGSPTETVTITVGGTGGTLSGGGVAPTGTANTYAVTGTLAQVDTALGQISFKPTAGQANTTSTATFSIVDKSSADATASAPDTTPSVVDTDPAVAPTVTGGTAGRTTISEAPVNGVFSGVAVSDSNAGSPTETVTITVGGTGGTLSGGGVAPTGTANTYAVTGTLAQVDTALGQISFKPTAGQANTTSTATFSIVDKSSADATASAPDTTPSVVDTDPAVAPAITGTHATADAAEATVTPFGTSAAGGPVAVSDTNAGATDTLTIALSGGGGTLADGTGYTALMGSGTSYTLTGSAAQITTELRALTFTPVNTVPGAPAVTTFSLTDASSAGTSSATDRNTVVTDQSVPLAPSAPRLTAATDTGVSNSDEVTNDVRPTFTGTAEVGATVTISDNGTAIGTETLTGAATTYTIAATSNLVQGSGNSVTATQTVAGVQSPSSGATAVTLDTVAPTITSDTASPATGALNAGRIVTFTLATSEAVTVTGTPTLTLNDGGTATYTGLTSTGSGSALTFSYTVAAGQNIAALAVTGVDLSTGATIQDTAGNAADLSGAATTFTGLQVDTTAPTITSIADSGSGIDANGNGDLGSGKTVTLTVTTSEAVTVTPGLGGATPTLTLNDGGTATYTGGSGTAQQTFSYTVAAGQTTNNLAVTAINANGAAVTDAAGNPISTGLSGAAVPSGTLVIDTTAPVASSPTLTVAQNASATPIGLAAPSDNLTPAGSIAIVAGSLPTDGTVTLADGTTRVTAGQSLTAAQLAGLEFTPTVGVSNQGSTFVYAVTDGAGNATTGTAALNVGSPGAPTIMGTHATATTSEAAVTPFAGVTVADPSAATETLTIALTGSGGTLTGTGLTANPNGTYTLTGTASAVTQTLDALSFTPTAGAAGTTSTTTFVLTDASSAGDIGDQRRHQRDGHGSGSAGAANPIPGRARRGVGRLGRDVPPWGVHPDRHGIEFDRHSLGRDHRPGGRGRDRPWRRHGQHRWQLHLRGQDRPQPARLHHRDRDRRRGPADGERRSCLFADGRRSPRHLQSRPDDLHGRRR
ncbi:MAG: beta strand repeat-containing protein [Janthinobacterium lividum]